MTPSAFMPARWVGLQVCHQMHLCLVIGKLALLVPFAKSTGGTLEAYSACTGTRNLFGRIKDLIAANSTQTSANWAFDQEVVSDLLKIYEV